MNEAILRRIVRQGREYLDVFLPEARASDSDFQRHRKLFVRIAQLASASLIAAGIVASMLTLEGKFSPVRLGCLIFVGLVYSAWNVVETRDLVRAFILKPETPPPTGFPKHENRNLACYFAIQVALVCLLFFLMEPKARMGLLWLALLPPVAHAALLLRVKGIMLVSCLMLAVFSFFFIRWHGVAMLPNALLIFGFATLFTLVFTALVASSEQARGEVQRLAWELSNANARLRQYAVEAEELAAARERNRLAREIHDALGHYLTVVNVQIEAAKVLLKRDATQACVALDKAQSLTREGLQDIRCSVSALRASPLDNKTLEQAVREVVENTRQSGVGVEWMLKGESRRLPPPVELTLFRVAQEGLTNVQKHSRATRAVVSLD
jgi:signal transduction histidine kinase